ncbi:MAG: type II toxin-antitoxin system CcdA family antitoxin [Pseudomonadales bacterium]|nr:type II toxin-antitoxin system CcdA family antitoxin [Pseudomonadales bacterium]
MAKGTQHASRLCANAPKRPVNLSLNADLVARARGQTGNLSELVEGLLIQYVAERQAEKDARAEALRATVATWNTFGDRYGAFSDEHSTL